MVVPLSASLPEKGEKIECKILCVCECVCV